MSVSNKLKKYYSSYIYTENQILHANYFFVTYYFIFTHIYFCRYCSDYDTTCNEHCSVCYSFFSLYIDYYTLTYRTQN